MMGSMLRRGAISGDGATLSLDFTTGVLDPLLTFSRSSSGTYIGADGLVKTATANTARFDYDPTTLAPRGLLIEGSASNVLQYSVAVDQSPWLVAGNVTRTNFTGGIGPDGVNNSGSKLSAVNISGSSSLYYNGVAFTSGTTYTYSVWAKADGANWIWISLHIAGAQHGAFFDLSGNGALGNTTGTVVSGSNTITKYPNGWFRLTVAHTAASNASGFPVLLPCTSNGTGYASITGQSPNGVLVYGAQLETGSGASSYIPTGASTGSRAADECSMNTTNFAIGSWYTAAQGTFYTDVQFTALSGNQSGIQLADNSGGSETNRLSIRRNIAIATRSGVTARQFTPTATGRAKSAFAYGTADYRFSQNGATFSSVAGDNGAPPNNIDRMTMFAPGAIQIYGWIRAIKFWPTSLSQDQLNSYTTL